MMALFKSAEEKEERRINKEQALMDKYGVGSLSDPADRESVKRIANELLGSGWMETGLKLSFAKAEIQLPISLQRAMMEQNFIIIRQLDRIAKMLEK